MVPFQSVKTVGKIVVMAGMPLRWDDWLPGANFWLGGALKDTAGARADCHSNCTWRLKNGNVDWWAVIVVW